MTSKELFEKLSPIKTDNYVSQIQSSGLNTNMSDVYTKLIRDAARCNHYSSDVYYDIKYIEQRLREFNPEEDFEPIWIGFRKMGVDGTEFVLSRIEGNSLYIELDRNYFALYSVTVESSGDGFYNVQLNQYGV